MFSELAGAPDPAENWNQMVATVQHDTVGLRNKDQILHKKSTNGVSNLGTNISLSQRFGKNRIHSAFMAINTHSDQ